jgi:hypothetical protein
MTLTQQGSLGVGTAHPIRSLTVNNGEMSLIAYADGSNNAWLNISDVNGSNGNAMNLLIRGLANGGSAGANLSNVNIYANAVWAWGTITAAGNSDRRLKQNIKPLTGTLSKLDRLRGVSFEWNHLAATSMGRKEGQKAIGMIAQEVQKVYPELVVVAPKRDGHQYLSIDYDKFTAVLLESVKELKKEKDEEIQKLQDDNEQLKSRVDALEKKARVGK